MNTETGAATLQLERLTSESFARFGEVIEGMAGTHSATNGNTAIRAHGIGVVDCGEDGGQPFISMYHYESPVPITPVQMMERHPISSQAFIPTGRMRLIIVVANPGAAPEAGSLRAFITNGTQGVNYRRGVWHHPLIALDPGSLIVIDRSKSRAALDQDYDEHWLPVPLTISSPAPLLGTSLERTNA